MLIIFVFIWSVHYEKSHFSNRDKLFTSLNSMRFQGEYLKILLLMRSEDIETNPGPKKQLLIMMMMVIMMMVKMMNCFCGMVDRRKAFSFISSRDHCPRSSSSRTSDTPRGSISTRFDFRPTAI